MKETGKIQSAVFREEGSYLGPEGKKLEKDAENRTKRKVIILIPYQIMG